MLGYPRLVTSPPQQHQHQALQQSGHRHMPSAQIYTTYMNVPQSRLPTGSRTKQLHPAGLRAGSPDQPFAGLLKAVQGGERPTYVSVDMTRKSEYSVSDGIQPQVSILQDSSNQQLHQSIHTTVLNQSQSRRGTTPQRQMLARQRDRLRRERQLFQREQEQARKEQQEIRLEQQRIRREQEQIRREQQLQKDRYNGQRDSNPKRSTGSQQQPPSQARSIQTHSQLPQQPEFVLDGSRLTRQTSSVASSAGRQVRQELTQQLRLRVEQLEQISERQVEQIGQTIEIAQRREKQLTENYESYIEQLRNEKLQLLDLNKTFEEEINKLRVDVERAHKTSSEHYSSEIQRLEAANLSKEKQLHALNSTVTKLEAALAANKGDEFDNNLKLMNFEKRVHLLESEIEKYTETIKAKNQEILELKNVQFKGDRNGSLNRHIQATSREVERLNELLLGKTSEVSQYRTEVSEFQMKLAKALHRNDILEEEKQLELNRKKMELQNKDFEYTRVRQSLLLKQTQIKELLAARDQSRQKLLAMEEEVDKVHNQHKYLISELQHKNSELEKRNKHLEAELKEARKILNSLQQSKSSPVREDKLRTLQEKLTDLTTIVERQKLEHHLLRKKSEETAILERLKLQYELKVQQLNWQLTRKDQQLAQLTQQNQQLLTANYQFKSKQEEIALKNDSLVRQLAETSEQLIARKIELDRKGADFSNHQSKANMYKLLYEQATSSITRKDSQDKHSSPFARSGKGTPSRLPPESSSKFKECSRERRDRLHHPGHTSPATRLISPDAPYKSEHEMDKSNKMLLMEVDRLNEVCRQYQQVLSKCNTSRLNLKETELIGITSRNIVPLDLPQKIEELRDKLTRSQSESQLLRAQINKQEELLRTVQTQFNLQKTQLQLQLRSIRTELDQQTKQRTFYEQENTKNQARIQQLSAQLTASILESPAPSLMTSTQDGSGFARQLECTIVQLKQSLNAANGTIAQLNNQRQHLLAQLRRYHDDLPKKPSQREISTISSSSLLRTEPESSSLIAQVYPSGQRSNGLQRQLEQCFHEGRQNRQTILNVLQLSPAQIYSTYVMFTERLRSICHQLQSLFAAASSHEAVPAPLNDLLKILEEILQWSHQQQRSYTEHPSQQ